MTNLTKIRSLIENSGGMNDDLDEALHDFEENVLIAFGSTIERVETVRDSLLLSEYEELDQDFGALSEFVEAQRRHIMGDDFSVD